LQNSFATYKGSDRYILGHIANVAIYSGRQKTVSWSSVVETLRKCYKLCDELEVLDESNYEGSEYIDLDLDVARLVGEDQADLPIFIVSQADRVLTREAGRTAPKLGAIANKERWEV
jgi:hypothetical protein